MTSKVISPTVARLLLLAVVVLWGANWPIVKVGLEFMPPLWFAAARMVLGVASFVVLLTVLGRLKLPTRKDLPVVFSIGVAQMTGFVALINFGLLYVDAGRSAILAYTTPLWVTPVAVWLLGEALTGRKIFGLALGLSGVAALFNPLGFDWNDTDALLGNGYLLGAALAWSIGILHVRAHKWDSSPLELAPWQMLVAVPTLVALSWFREDWSAIVWSPEAIGVLIYNGPIATAFCFWASVAVTRALPAITSSLSFLAVPVAGVLFSALLLGETLTATLVSGLALIIGGMALVNLREARPAEKIGKPRTHAESAD
ncbi:DMT family transporter [Pelagibius litoralis]|uniref:DMT family transporter n=1 Tax=Pelagibius litoralis TaxID=374515 RepID=A0A967F284_9PROT|nr:DMT family transporter [Pelagibius litoralis]NIA71831.1 DMT family transporter [Pelagibius litoralis]